MFQGVTDLNSDPAPSALLPRDAGESAHVRWQIDVRPNHGTLHEILQILSSSLFEKTLLDELLTMNPPDQNLPRADNQLSLFV